MFGPADKIMTSFPPSSLRRRDRQVGQSDSECMGARCTATLPDTAGVYVHQTFHHDDRFVQRRGVRSKYLDYFPMGRRTAWAPGSSTIIALQIVI